MGKMVEKSTTGTQQIRGLFNNEVELYQFMAQDNIPFHTIIFHATLIFNWSWRRLYPCLVCWYDLVK